MQTDSIRELVGWAFAYLALAGFGVCAAVLIVQKAVPFLGRLWRQWLHLDGCGRVIVLLAVIGATMYGGSKGFWGRVPHDGGDDILTVTGIYTGVSNVVDTTQSPPVTNHVPMVRVEWLGNGGTADTPVSIRASETNEWTEIVKLDPVVSIEGITNTLTFVTETNYTGVAFWWFGVDRPAIVVTEEGIEIKQFLVTTRTVHLAWVCGEREATHYVIRRRLQGQTEWEDVANVPAHYGVVNEWTGELFTVDKTYDWCIQTTIQEGGEQ